VENSIEFKFPTLSQWGRSFLWQNVTLGTDLSKPIINCQWVQRFWQ
jgi:hypothetical protein